MSHDHVKSSPAPKARIPAILTALACASAAWAVNAGSVLAPTPAELGAPLGSWSGATAAAVYFKPPTVTQVLVWSGSTWTAAAWLAPGTPCSVGPLFKGDVVTHRIVAQYEGAANKKCLPYNNLQPPPANFLRPLPPMPMADGGKITYTQIGGFWVKVQKAVVAATMGIVTAINWPADWHHPDGDLGETTPDPGQPCSDFALLVGESTYKHIQWKPLSSDFPGPYYYRCVSMDEPIIYPGSLAAKKAKK